MLTGVLPAGAGFPFDLGFAPSTRVEEGDPLDILVLMDAPVFPGCVVPSRLVGVIEAEQTEDGKTCDGYQSRLGGFSLGIPDAVFGT